MKVSILLRCHRFGGMDMLLESLKCQTFPKEDYEVIICDKLYKYRKNLVAENFKDFNIVHFEQPTTDQYYAQSKPLNDCLERASGELSIILGDYSFCHSEWILRHWIYHMNNHCVCAPQRIYGLPPLKNDLKNYWSTFKNTFDIDIFKLLPVFNMDPKLSESCPHNAIVNWHFWYNRNESFPTQWAKDIGGWDESYDKSTSFNNQEFALRLVKEKDAIVVNDIFNSIHRIMSFPIGPHYLFLNPEHDDSLNRKKYEDLCKKYGVIE